MKNFICKIIFLFLISYAVPAHALTSGATTTGSISAGGTSNQNFTGTSGQGIVLYAQASYTVVITVYKPDGSYWGYGYNRFSGTLPATGTYNVVISGYSSTDSGTYNLAYVRGSAGVSNGSLTSGQSYNGTLATNGIESFQFTGTSGQGVVLYGNASYDTVITVYKPDGSYWSYGYDRFSGTLPASGTYTALVTGYNYANNGAYRLDYVRGSSSVSDGSLTSGQSYNGTLATNGIESFQFTGTSGQGVILYGNASYDIVITVYKPDGSYWSYGYDRFSGTLPATGTYTAVVTGYAKANNGSYRLDYVCGSAGVSDGSLTSGQSYNGTLATNGIESFQFTGTSGQGVILYGNASYDTVITVYKPDGSYWSYGYNRFSHTLPASGTYTVVVTGYSYANNGAYRLDYVRGSSSVSDGSLTSGQSYNGTLATNGIESFQFTGTSGQGVILYGNASYDTVITVYKPDGSYWSYGYDRFSGTLPATGTYTVVVTGYAKANNGSYRLDYVRGSAGVSDGTLFSGSQRAGTLPINGLESYKFSGGAGNSLSVASTGSYTRTISLYKPDGSYWTYGYNSVSQTLPATGEYTLLLTGYTKTDSGAYTVTVITPSAPVAASTPSKVGADTMACPSGMNNMAGDSIEFDVGFKKQTEADYDAGGLTFFRIYRSDSMWTDNTIGALWRHNYARTLAVSGATAAITDGTGATAHYTLTGGNWAPDDPGATATLHTAGSNYVYTLPDNTVEKYNSSKQLTRIEYIGGGALNLAYNGSGQLTSVTNENGRQLTLTYSSGRVATLGTPDGTFSYSYDGNGNLTQVTKPSTKTRQYHYENGTYVKALTGITDESGVRFATFNYNANGKAILSEHAGSVDDYSVAYNANGTSTVTNPLGKDTTYYFTNILGVRKVVQVNGEASTNCVSSNRYYNYDQKGRVISKTDWENNITRYEYDARGNITKVIEASGTPQERVKTITYDGAYNLPDLITEPGKTTDYNYDAYGRVTSVTVTDTTTSETRVTTYDYYANTTDGGGNLVLGRLKEVDRPRTDVSDITEYEYDGNLNLTKITNPLGQETQITARDAAGRPTRIEDANGVETDFVYDTNGRLQSSTVAPGTALEAKTAYNYDDNGNLTQVTLPNGVSVQYSYDNAQRLTGVKDALGNTITYTLDAAGNITQEDIKDSSLTLKYTHDQVFDELSRIIHSVGASTQTRTYAWDKNSNLKTFTDANTNMTGYAYDPLQRLVDTTDALSGVTHLGYSGLDDVTSVTDQRNNTTTYTYNAFGNVTGEVSPDRGALSYTVDKAGNITSRMDARSVVTNYTWDALNRVTSIAYPSDSSLNATLTYDLTTGCGTAGIGRLCSVTEASGTTAYEYNDLGHLTGVNETRGALSFTTAYTYDLAGNVLTVTLPSGRVVTYTRNANGQVSGVSAIVGGSPVNLASSITYLPFGPVNAMTYGNSLTFSATYDTDYYPTNRTVSGDIYNHTYDTDDNGNITQIGGRNYGYDALNRLDEEDLGSSTTYTYDATSNRLTKVNGGTVTTTVPSTSNKISAVGGTNYTYDAAGNITAIGASGYVWSPAGLLKEYKVSGVTAGAYTYDSQNRRVKKVAGSNTVHYVYGLNGLLYGEYDNSGAMLREYVYLDDQPLAQIDVGSPEVLTYLHPDHLGTPRFGTNSGGTQVWAWASDAFGVGAPMGSRTVNLRMPGQYYDAESGLFYNRNRYYNPATGRYISSDPIGLDGGLNTFLYAKASPVMYIDPEGLRRLQIRIPSTPGLIVSFICAAIPGCVEGVVNGTQNLIKWCQQISKSEAPKDAKDPNGAKAPGKPGEAEGFKDPKGGEKWVKNPNGPGYGWQDYKGRVWVPTGPAGAPGTGTTGPAHGGPHWDVQKPNGGYVNVRPGQKIQDIE